MKNTQISVQYQETIHEYCATRGIPSIIVDGKIEWLAEPGIVKSQVRYIRFYVGPTLVVVDLEQLCKSHHLPYHYTGKTNLTGVITLPNTCVPLIVDYCEQHQLDYESVISKLTIVDEPIEVPLRVDKTHVSVRSTKPGRVYDVLFTPKFLKFLRDPSYGSWMYVSEQDREAVEVAASLLYLDADFLSKHIKWVTDEEDIFIILYNSRVVLGLDGNYKYLNLTRFKRIALGEEPVSYEQY